MKVSELIRVRKTEKILYNVNTPTENSPVDYDIAEWLETASQAPFHYPSDETHHANGMTSVVPWRFYVLDGKACRKLLTFLQDNNIDSGKIGQMLAGCDYLIQTTWLPDPTEKNDVLFESSLQNMEHIAGASSAIQNLLLIATENKIPNYWSSGGKLRTKQVSTYLEIPSEQILLGSVFLFPQQNDNTQTIPGAWRNKRGAMKDYLKMI